MNDSLTVLQMKYLAYSLDKCSIEDYQKLLKELSKFHTHDNKTNYIIRLDKYIIESENNSIIVKAANPEYIINSYRKWSKKSLISKIESEVKKIKYNNYRNILAELYYNKIRNKWLNDEQLQIINKAFNLANISLNNLSSIKVYNNTAYGIIEDSEDVIGYINTDKTISYRIQDKNIDLKELDKNKYNIDFELLKKLINDIKCMEFIESHYIESEGKQIILITECISKSFEEVKSYFYNKIYPELINKNCSIV